MSTVDIVEVFNFPQRFQGGQLEMQGPTPGQNIRRGEIRRIQFDAESFPFMVFHMEWFAAMLGLGSWKSTEQFKVGPYVLGLVSWSDLGGGRVACNVPETDELIVLFPPDGSRLDPADIPNLKTAPPESAEEETSGE